MSTATLPPRSLQQRLDALATANEVRIKRANLKKDLRAGRMHIRDVLGDLPECVLTAKTSDILLAVPKLGRVRVNKLLSQAHISPTRTLGGVTERQRDELARLLTR